MTVPALHEGKSQAQKMNPGAPEEGEEKKEYAIKVEDWRENSCVPDAVESFRLLIK